MGYTKDFVGAFKCTPALSDAQRDYLKAFCEKRRMKRRTRANQKPRWPSMAATGPLRKVQDLPDPLRIAAGIKSVGPEGAYFTGGTGHCGQDNDSSVLDQNQEPAGQPGLWCKWEPDDNGEYIGWDGCEKFYDSQKWLEYLIEHFLTPWGVKLNGVVRYQGECRDDFGAIVVVDNVVETKQKEKLTPTHPKVMPRHSTLYYNDVLLDSVGALQNASKKSGYTH